MIDKSKFLATFKSEADDLIIKLQNGILELEKKSDNPELINELNRLAHTLKGAARMMGFTEIQDKAHGIEDTFASIAKNEYPFTQEITTKTLKEIDAIIALLNQMFRAKPGEEKVEIQDKDEDKDQDKELDKVVAEEYIKVPLRRIDELVNLVGETIVSKSKAAYKSVGARKILTRIKKLHQQLALLSDKTGVPELHQLEIETDELKKEMQILEDNISAEAMHLDPLINELQAKAREMRMLPAATIFDNYPRLIRDLATAQNKNVDFVMTGVETEVDKKILEEINPALIHLLRNAVDHGIKEKGQVKLSARHEGGNIFIEVGDDGGGIDIAKIKETALRKKMVSGLELDKMSEREIINFIFLPGFSTSPIITDVSGRGVGLDVVKTQVDKARGQVKVETNPGAGTKIILKLPLTVAIIRALFVEAGGQTLVLPLLSVDETISLPAKDLNSLENNYAINLREHTIPVVDLAQVLGFPSQLNDKAEIKEYHLVIVSSLEKKLGLIVDKVLREEEIYIKPLGEYLGEQKNIEGAAIVGTGDVVIVLDVADLIESAAIRKIRVMAAEQVVEEAKAQILIVEDSFTTRELEKSILEAQGYVVETAVDGLDGMDKLSAHRPNLIVTDIQMPRMDGFVFCQTVKQNENLKEIPVVMVTALEKEEDKRRGIEVGADAYITKGSFDQKNLLETIERLLG